MDKRLERIRQNPKHVRPQELDHVLRDAGYEATQRGSHMVYRHDDFTLSVPQHKPFLSPVYVRQALKLLDEEMEGGE